jgi:hypothetical protein
MDRMPIDHVYYVKLTVNDNVKPYVKVGDALCEAKEADLDWKANDSVTFNPDDGFDMRIEFIVPTSPGFIVDTQPPLGDQPVKDALSRKVLKQAQQGGKKFGFHCTLINSNTQETFGWEKTKDGASGSLDGNVHN